MPNIRIKDYCADTKKLAGRFVRAERKFKEAAVAGKRAALTEMEAISREQDKLAEEFETFNEEEKAQIRAINGAVNGSRMGPRVRALRTPKHDQEYFEARDLAALWPLSLSSVHKRIREATKAGKIKPGGIERPKIDTVRTSKRAYNRIWLTRRDKEKLEKELGLPVGGRF